MKASAVTRIIIYTLMIVLLLGILLSALGVTALSFLRTNMPSPDTKNQGSVGAELVNNISVDWSAGSITIITADTDEIHIQETGQISEKYVMEYEIDDGTLEIAYADEAVVIGFGSMPEKDLCITVPKNWTCNELELDAAAVGVYIKDVAINEVKCDGAALELDMVLSMCPKEIDIDGAGCEISIDMPSDYGYQVQMQGLGCEFESNVAYTTSAGSYYYGGRDCKVNIDGLGCELTINLSE